MELNKELRDDFWRRVKSWNGYRQNCFTGVRQIGDWQMQFRTPDGLTGIYDGLRHITRRVFDNFDDMDEYWFNWEISCNIEHYMNRMGYSIESFAADVGTSAPTMYNYLNCKTSPRADIIFRMAKVLDCTPDDLFYVESRYR